MNEFIVWDKHRNIFTDKYVNIRPDGTLWKLTRNKLVNCKDSRYEVFNYIGKKDINNKKIYADSSIVEFEIYIVNTDYTEDVEYTLNGVFTYNYDELRYEIVILNDDKFICLNYDTEVQRNFKIIDTIQENKLGLIK